MHIVKLLCLSFFVIHLLVCLTLCVYACDSLRIFSVAGAIGIFVLLPINYLGGQLSDIDFADIPNQSLDLFSISNVQNGSKW